MIAADEEALEATVAARQITVTEGTVATFVVSLTGPTSSAPVVIDYGVSGATEGEDYTAPSGKLTIPAGATSGTISIQTLDDGVLDRGEMLTVTLMGGRTPGGVTVTVPAHE